MSKEDEVKSVSIDVDPRGREERLRRILAGDFKPMEIRRTEEDLRREERARAEGASNNGPAGYVEFDAATGREKRYTFEGKLVEERKRSEGPKEHSR